MMGIISIIFSILVTLVLFFMSKISNTETIRIFTFLAQISGLVGSILISLNFILATRLSVIENIFGGLDKVYKTHNIIGNIAFVLVVNHPIFLILESLPFNTSGLYLVPKLSNLPYAFGILALYSLILLISLTIFIDMPYKLWKKTHEFIGIVVIFGILHSVTITSDLSNYLPLKIWILGWGSLALVAYLYKRYFYYLFNPKNNYIITSIRHEKSYLLLNMTSTDPKKFLNFNAGQFAFFSLNTDRKDEHPFSILEQDGPNLKVGTKVIGDFTLALTQLRQNDKINVFGPFGSFSDNLDKPKHMVWISAGIGITPFLTMIKKIKDSQKVTMIHSSRIDEPQMFIQRFKEYEYYFPNFEFKVHRSDIDGRLNEINIKKYVELDSDTYVYICGPYQMMEYMSENLPKEGVKKKRIIFEDFVLKP